ncbi:hypothetical protein SAMN04487950_0534 [Halogranum rubrum]|uniref:Uncharacterized protein n=1 Tax=Halogranum rubrum TaxID=553466 RepID=A0A1I4BGS2_9EURY|nr:hypothetical protein [Halogranum rubrum]SFK67693.1 hypothetical protein SAMN04487950_0534 [Halogranum rubrum]
MPDGTDSRFDRIWLLATGVLLVIMPALTLFVAYAVLIVTQSVALERITLAEAVELYLVELAAFALFSYFLYRLTRYTIHRQEMQETARNEREREQSQTDGARPR